MDEHDDEPRTRAGTILTPGYEADLAAEAEEGFGPAVLVRRPAR